MFLPSRVGRTVCCSNTLINSETKKQLISSVAERHWRVLWRTQQKKGCIETGWLLKTLVGQQSQIERKHHWGHWANVPWPMGWIRDCKWCVCFHSNEHHVWWSVSSKILELPSEDNILTCGKVPRVCAQVFYHSRWWPGSEYCKKQTNKPKNILKWKANLLRTQVWKYHIQTLRGRATLQVAASVRWHILTIHS